MQNILNIPFIKFNKAILFKNKMNNLIKLHNILLNFNNFENHLIYKISYFFLKFSEN